MRTAKKHNSLLVLQHVGLCGSVEDILIHEIRAEFEIYFFGVIIVMYAVILIERTNV
jgi:hypothetical protein